MDGVLIDARDWHYEALNRALRLFGYSISRDEHLAQYDGLPTSKKLAMLTKSKNLPAGLHSFINELKQDFTVDVTLRECRPKFIHEYALSMLKAQGFNLAVASNSISSTIKLMMEKSNLIQYLDFYLSNEDVSEPKPSPEIYLKAINILGLQPSEVVVVEDNMHGIKAAQAAGANVFIVESPEDVTFENIINYIESLKKNA